MANSEVDEGSEQIQAAQIASNDRIVKDELASWQDRPVALFVSACCSELFCLYDRRRNHTVARELKAKIQWRL